MTIRIDPENNETRALFDMADFSGQYVLEIGCGDGRLTWRYADKAAHVTAIEPAMRNSYGLVVLMCFGTKEQKIDPKKVDFCYASGGPNGIGTRDM